MKKFLICIIVLVLFGCSTNTETQGEIKQKPLKDKHDVVYFDNKDYDKVFGVEIEGHQYIIFSGYYKGNIIHAEHCPCHNKIE